MSYQQDKLEWFDFKIDAFVNFTMNFNGVYSLIEWLVDQINTYTKEITNRDGAARTATKDFTNYINDINSNTQQNINLLNPFGYIDSEDQNLLALEEERNRIKEVNQYMIDREETPYDKKLVLQKIIDTTDQRSRFSPQTQELNSLQDQVHLSLSDARDRLQWLGSGIKDYDSFLASLQNSPKEVAILSGQQSFSSKLFDNTSNTKLPQESLMTDYVALQKKLLSNFDKWLHEVQNENNKQEVKNIRNEIAYLDQGLDLTKRLYEHDIQSVSELHQFDRKGYSASDSLQYNNQAMSCALPWETTSQLALNENDNVLVNTFPSLALQAQVGWSTSNSPSPNYNSSNLYDFSSYKDKLMIPFSSKSWTQYIDVLESDYFSEQSQGHQVIDINNDKQNDIIHRSQDQVWIKYGQQNNSHTSSIHKANTKYYLAPYWSAPTTRENLSTSDGYLKITDTSFKVFSPHWAVKNLNTSSQDYDSFTLSRSNAERQQSVDGYVLQISPIAENYQLKAEQDLPSSLQSRYVILLPEDNYSKDGTVSLHNLLKAKKIAQLIEQWVVLAIVPYDRASSLLSYSFTNIPRSRYYTRIATLNSNQQSKAIFNLASPRSHGVVAWQQLIADDVWPIADIRLIREKTNKTIDSWLNPYWLVNTKYRLEIERNDPSWVVSNQILSESGSILSDKVGTTNTLGNLYFTSSQQLSYTIQSHDGRWNISKEKLLVTINVPSIQIEDIIQDNLIPGGLTIFSKLSKGMDEGIVKFERKRGGSWTTLFNPKSLSDTPSFVYPLWFDQTVISGGVYNKNHDIEFFDNKDKSLVTMKKESGEILIDPQASTRVGIKVDISSQVPTLVIYDKTNQATLFEVVPQLRNTSIDPNPPYSLQSLSGPQYGSFGGWQCLADADHNCMIVMDTLGNIIIPQPYNNELKASAYRFVDGQTSFRISTDLGAQIWTLHFNASLP